MRKIWVKAPGPLRLTAGEKDALLDRTRAFIVASKNHAPITSRVDLQNGRIFLYFLYQPTTLGGPSITSTTPLIEEKYVEGCYARITLFNAEGSECAAEYERKAGQWVTAWEGPLEVCLKSIEDKKEFQTQFASLHLKRSPVSPLNL